MRTQFMARCVLAGIAARRRVADRGATAVEYALFMALVAAVIVGAVAAFGQSIIGLFTTAEGVFP
ncbi:pilus assembly protein Flp/PilA [Hamadaea flava]|uniref:Flp family type IVb pilin n=1 Tax=Hamadaea flava TaxID=1742688 RepID=A0ABV8LFB3_9ACTN|nr:Flp family type IVb pilin [Hamadaea flava]MCP2326018.1 pilus assembly protein Flp/PilA [Hamadaea flava]